MYSGNLTGSDEDNNLSLSTVTFTGMATGFDALTIAGATSLNADLTISGTTTLSGSLAGTGHLTTTMVSGTVNPNIATLTITGEQTSAISFVVAGEIANTVTLAGGGSGAISLGGGDDTIVVSSIYTGNLDGRAGTMDTLRLAGGTVSGTLSGFEKFEVTAGSSVLDSDLTVTGNTTISGTLQIAEGHTLTTGTGAEVTNQVASGGTLDISKLADDATGIGTNGITVVAGGTLAIGMAKSRNASNITLTRGANEETSSTISINLGVNAATSTTALFSTAPTLDGEDEDRVTLEISGSLAGGATQVLFESVPDVTDDYRLLDTNNLELVHESGNIIIRGKAIELSDANAGLTERGHTDANFTGDQNLTDGTSTYNVKVMADFDDGDANLNVLSDVEVKATATVGDITANNIVIEDGVSVGNLVLNTTTSGGLIRLTQTANAITVGTITGSSSTSDILMVSNSHTEALVLSTITGIETLRLAGMLTLNSAASFGTLEITNASTLNGDIEVATKVMLSANLLGTGTLTANMISGLLL